MQHLSRLRRASCGKGGGGSCGKGGIKVSAVLLPPDAFARQGGGRPVAKGLLKVKVSIVLLTPGEDFQ